MVRVMTQVDLPHPRRRPTTIVRLSCIAGCAALAAGCSADITRFGAEPSFSLNDPGATGSVATPLGGAREAPLSAQEPSASGYGGGYTRPTGRYSNSVDTAALSPPPASSYGRPEPARRPVDYAPPQGTPSPDTRENSPAAFSGSGDVITVERGDTLYGLSRRHNVTITELKSVNGLTSSNLRTGQQLTLPSGASDRGARGLTTTAPASSRRPPPEAVAAADLPSDWTGTYEVVSGDSLYKIARQFGTRSSDLQRYNGLTDVRNIRPGTVLKVPGSYGSGRDPGSSRIVAEARPSENPRILDDASPSRPSIINSGSGRVGGFSPGAPAGDSKPKPVQTVRVSPPKIDRPQSGGNTNTKLRWPARGKIIDGFGPRNDGTHNDGINLAVPRGADVHAAEDGVVAYAGSELKGYGNLVLLRHANGWVTAYAHNDKLLVKRGEKITRGQVIAKAGNTGGVGQPQLHFELRKGAKPVDPRPYLERL